MTAPHHHAYRILDLSLTYHWYDEIAAGHKHEEYRDLTYYWRKRLMLCRAGCTKICEEGCRDLKMKQYDAVRFHRGQGGKTSMTFECNGISIGKGRVTLGASALNRQFIIALGKRLDNG